MKVSEFALSRTDQDVEADAEAPLEIREPTFFSRFFKAEWPRLRTYLSRFAKGDEAEEIAQEAFTRVYAAPGEIRSPSGLLYQTARNLVIDRRRARNVAGSILVEDAGVESVPDPHALPEDQVDWRQRLARAAAMLDRMAPRCRQIFLLQVIDGYTYAEIAGQLGISVAAVKKQLLRAFEICAAHAETEERLTSRRGRRAKRARETK